MNSFGSFLVQLLEGNVSGGVDVGQGSGGLFQSLWFGGSVHTDVSMCTSCCTEPCVGGFFLWVQSREVGDGAVPYLAFLLCSIQKGFPQEEMPQTHQAWEGLRLPLISALEKETGLSRVPFPVQI